MKDHSGLYLDESRPCSECGVPTNRIDVNFECAVCLGCVPRVWSDYWKAISKESE